MFAVFNSLEAYNERLEIINIALGYPDGNGTDRYATESPRKDVSGNYVMQILPHVERFFVDCVVVESVEYPEIEVTDEID